MNCFKKINIFIVSLILNLQIQNFFIPVAAKTVKTASDFWSRYNAFFKEFQLYLNIFLALGIILTIGILVYHITQLGIKADNPQARQESINNLAITSICLALNGGIVIFIYVLYYLSASAIT